MKERDFSKNGPPALLTNLDKFGRSSYTARCASIWLLQVAAIAPINIKRIPSAHPHKDKTYGKHKTPEPIAHAHNENILPLTLPLPIGPNVLCLKFLELEIGDIANFDSFISISVEMDLTC